MNIVIFGAGAIGSLIGALLNKKNNVTLIGRSQHINAIKKKGLTIEGETQLNVKISAEDNIDNLDFSPDLLILTVKSFDTETAIRQIKRKLTKNTPILSLQNGLDNIEKIEKYIDRRQIIVGNTTHGAFFSKPGYIIHTGTGNTVLGELNGIKTDRLEKIVDAFNKASIKTDFSKNVIKDIWIKAIVNSSINPLTTIFQCRNGYLLENPILEKIVEKICLESTNIANNSGIRIQYKFVLNKTKEVIRFTSNNYSSMFQSIRKGKKTEIDSINGKIVEIGKKHSADISLNNVLVQIVLSIKIH